MATTELDRGNGDGHGGPARGYKWADAEPGNLLALKSGFWIDPNLREEHRVELEEIGGQIWSLLPFRRPEFALAVAQLALRLWRQRRGYRDLTEHGLVRDGRPAPLLAELAKVENAIQRDLVELGLTPRSAAALGLDLARGERELSVLEYYEQRERAGLPLFDERGGDE
jgi:hypothetical protein